MHNSQMVTDFHMHMARLQVDVNSLIVFSWALLCFSDCEVAI